MIKLTLNGNTYGLKNTLKELGSKWDPVKRGWSCIFEKSEMRIAEELASRWAAEGVYGRITTLN